MQEIIIDRACGLDVHKASVTACIKGENLKKQIRTFGTTTNELIELTNWLKKNKITHLAMESTGVYWKPVFNILEDYEDLKLLLVNARHIKHVPGRKTDVKDSEWLCKLLRSGLLKGSFIPSEEIRNLRDLTRYERKMQNQFTRIKNRIHKLLHECNIKISNVISDIFGVTGLKILNDLASGNTNPISLSEHFLSVKRLEKKQKEAQEALNGKVTEHHQFILKKMLNEISFVKEHIYEINSRVEDIITKSFSEEKRLLNTIPGISDKATHIIISELGVNMDVFPTSNHASSWAGLCPGNNESAGKKKSSRLKEGNKYLRPILVQCGWAAIKKEKSYLKNKYYSLCGRIGAKKSLCAIAHKLIQSSYQVLSTGQEYKELGDNYLEKDIKIKLAKNYIKRLAKLGYNMTMEICAN